MEIKQMDSYTFISHLLSLHLTPYYFSSFSPSLTLSPNLVVHYSSIIHYSSNCIKFSFQRKRLTIYDMGTALLAGNGLFHSWMLCLPMLIIVQSSYYNFIRLLLSTMFVLYFTKWSPYYKIYQIIQWLISLLRYRRVEKFCDKCERQLLQQLNNVNTMVKQTESSFLRTDSNPIDEQSKEVDSIKKPLPLRYLYITVNRRCPAEILRII